MLIPCASPVIIPEITYHANSATDVTGTTHDFTSVAIGAAASNRVVIIPVGVNHSTITVSSATIGGVSASIVGGTTLNSQIWVAFLYAVVPTGTTATVALTFSGSLSTDGVFISSYRMVGGAGAPRDNDTAYINSTSVSLNLNVPDGGAVVAQYIGADSGSAVSWTGPTEDFDVNSGVSGGWQQSGAHINELSTDATYTVQATSVSQSMYLLAGVWR